MSKNSKIKPEIEKKVKYTVEESDSDDWVIIELVDKNIKLDIEKRIFFQRYDCIPHHVTVQGKEVYCSRFCCYAGCYVSPVELRFIEEILPELKKKYLPKDSLDVLNELNDEFYLPEDYDEDENLYKTRCAPIEAPPHYLDDIPEENEIDYDDGDEDDNNKVNDDSAKDGKDNTDGEYEDEEDEDLDIDTYEDKIYELPESHCLFLMENGYCSIHSYCNDNGIDWTKEKFNICTTFPMDLRVSNNSSSKDVPRAIYKRVNDDCSTVKMMDDYQEFLFTEMDCISLPAKVKERKNVPYILDSMKYAFVTRYGEDMWIALTDYAQKIRQKK